jgi:hypothetical protein
MPGENDKMPMRRYIFLLFVIIAGFSVNDVQKEIITLEWSDITGRIISEEDVLVETILSEMPNELPVYSRLFDVDSNSSTLRLLIENPVFEELNDSITFYNDCEIGEELSTNTLNLKSGNSQKVELQIIPFKKEDGKIYRLTSFELKQFPDLLKSAETTASWKTESVLNTGKWVKISTNGKGIYRIPYSKLSDWGFSSPDEVGVFGSGATFLSEDPGEIEYDDLEECAVWSNTNGGEECLFFYAPGYVEWNATSAGYFEHELSDYTQLGYFFLGELGSSRKSVSVATEITETPTNSTYSYDAYELIESELYNILEAGSGKQWFGKKFLSGNTKSFSFSIENMDEEEPVYLKINAAGRSYASSKMVISSGDNTIGSLTFSSVSTTDSYADYASEKNSRYEVSTTNGTLSLSIAYSASNSSAEAWLDYLELNYRRKLEVNDDVVFFRDSRTVGTGNIVEFSIENAGSDTKVLDVSDVNNVIEVPSNLSGTDLTIRRQADVIKEYALFNSSGDFETPTWVADVENQNLHGLDVPEYLIVSHANFMSSAEELADFHRDYDGMSVEVVDVETVYNEFSSGTKSATGIRNFIKMLYDKGSTLKYVLLFGDGSYDNKDIISTSNDFIPTFQSENSLSPISSFVTDDYFVMLDDGESVYSGAIDLGIGRIPASTAYEAQLVVDKVLRYYEPEALGEWRNRICFIGDDEDSGIHMQQSEVLADTINKNYKEFITDKIYLDAYVEEVTTAGETYPDVTEAINDAVNDGVLVLNYTGHANELYLAEEQITDVSDINSWSNTNLLPIFVTATCEFSRFDADDTSAGEYVLLNPSGGGIGLFSTTRVVYSSANFLLNKSFFSFIFAQDENGDHYRMGDVMRLAKNNISSSINKRNFSLLADPALKLSYPKYRVQTTTINSEDATQTAQTIGTLEQITIEGNVTDYFGNVIDDFNGEIIPTVYDKEVTMETLGNSGQKQVEFGVQENIIYKGRASVSNGSFSFSFVVPKDISYSQGQGKIVYYADNGDDDAHGAFDNFYIGGSDSDVSDDQGPEISLYMDSKDFESGDVTSKNPTLLAYLSDENGINTVGTGIGHDITAILDDDYSDVWDLNNYYVADKDDYTQGTVEYPLSDLSTGVHTLKLKAWDVANNSSEVEIEFEVTGDFIIDEISNYPNPLSSYTYFVITHNQSGETLDAIVFIYNQHGQLIDQFQSEVGSSGSTTNPIRWDLGESGVLASAGMYVYRVVLQNSEGVIASKSGKMIIAR